MKDPKVQKKVTELRKLVEKLNELSAELFANDVTFSLHSPGHGQKAAQYEISHLVQRVTYEDE